MILILFSNFLDLISNFFSIELIIILSIIFLFIIFLYNTIIFIVYLKRIREYKNYKDPHKILTSDFISLPLVNIIIPAWKEGELFKNLLSSITKLIYPKIKVITNAGGNEETIQIARNFEKYENYIILHQKGGSVRPSLGKIKALNECLEHVSEGIVYFIDADSDIDDEIFLRMIHPLINLEEEIVVGGVRPLKEQIKKPLVKYLQFERFRTLERKFNRKFKAKVITGQNFCIKYNVLESFDKFSYQKLVPTDSSMGRDIFSKGFSAYRLVDYRHRIYVDYSSSLKEYFHQRLVWNENFLYKSIKFHEIKNIAKFLFLWIMSSFLLVSPILIFLDLRLILLGIIIFISIFFKKIRRLVVFTKAIDREFREPYKITFYFNLLFYIIFDALIISYVLFHFIYFIRKIRNDNGD